MASNQNKGPVDTEQNNTQQTGSSAEVDKKVKKPYEESYLRVSKNTLYMIIALWMEDFVEEAPEQHRRVGAVLVLPNDVALAADCSRDEVHAAARLLIKHSGKTHGCKMFMSRKPCPFCAKLLVQSKVKRVFFLPTREPEYYRPPEDIEADQSLDVTGAKSLEEYNDEKMKEVEIMFTASAIAQTKFVLRVEEPVGNLAKKLTPNEIEKDVQERTRSFSKKYSPDESSKWDIDAIKTNLPWPSYDKKMHKKVHSDFAEVMEWIARVLVTNDRGLNYKFISCNEKSENSTGFNPLPLSNSDDEKKALRFIEIARLLAQRTDDPTTGVGAVIVSQEMEVLAFGWNGYPFGAQYGEFARASDKDNKNAEDDEDNTNPHEKIDEKYPYSIHAEQNALLMRNSKNLKDAILFVTKCPCDECTPLLAMEGIKTVVVDDDILSRMGVDSEKKLGYKRFPKMVEEGKFVCFETQKKQAAETGIAPGKAKQKVDL
ncbi:cytidine and dCMP deaminase domain-containing protein 1-like [Dendronephthya gigantea]|uniref:cytidine and dCMP deaminase domain-containing protein 1-like n=1 Tax=Dendronephthya gigantea TaxID=151771 RepID=UPI00106B7EF3|nr:cytidine and dCMP deaminase domain-containing protein 1-like [Dendronephthya gigantea]